MDRSVVSVLPMSSTWLRVVLTNLRFWPSWLIEGVELGSQTAEGDEAIIDRGHLAGRDARQQGPVFEPLEAGMEDLPGGARPARFARQGPPSACSPGPGCCCAQTRAGEPEHG